MKTKNNMQSKKHGDVRIQCCYKLFMFKFLKVSFKLIYRCIFIVFFALMTISVIIMLDDLRYTDTSKLIFWVTVFLILSYIPYKISQVFGDRIEESIRKQTEEEQRGAKRQ